MEEIESFDDELLEDGEVDEPPKKAIRGPAAKRRKAAQPKKIVQRYSAFAVPERVGIADAETGDVIAEGPTAILQALADIECRLERIETSIGGILEN